MKSISQIFLFLLTVFLTVSSPFFKRLTEEVIFSGIIIILSLGVALGLTFNFKKILFLSSFLLVLFSLWFGVNHFDKKLVTVSPLERLALKERQNYFYPKAAKILFSESTLTLYKYNRNLFTNLDFNQFFFAGRPRYRDFALDFPKFQPYLLPFLIIGLILIIKRGLKLFLLTSVLVLLLVAVSDPSFTLGPLPIYPLITGVISLGVFKSIVYFILLARKIC
ncbi:MAG: hypothetical protein Q7S88_01315 [Candidatus Daviesbacteria bacterium]|nr:hypothetical protein [Candidatus Daviesbacteria bacterium]